MSLTPEQKQTIRDEEFFRAEVRKELAAAGGPPTFLTRLSMFFDTKAGFWLLTTALAGLVATGITALQRYIDREEIAARENAERALRDTETLLKLGPMLTSDKPAQVDMAIVLLDGLASDDAVDPRVSTQVKSLIRKTLDNGLQQDASPEQRAQAAAILSYADQPRIDEIQSPDPSPPAPSASTSSLVSAAIDTPSLPIRVYIQIGQERDRGLAQTATESLRAAGFVVPGIEVVGARRTPGRDSVRYCQNKVTPAAVERLKAAGDKLGSPPPEFVVLDRKLCGNVRFNHFELWFARRTA